mmetsp:Transcript_77654/g.251286  ORF Transcript_77654/g.251286 Transcript_77654/m.251286 type:complete len:730 (-) Transcript_77654:549-2738(-)
MSTNMYANFTVRDSCTKEDIAREEQWTLSYDIGVPAKQMFNIIYGTLVYIILCCMIHVYFLQKDIPAPALKDTFWRRIAKSKEFWYRVTFLVLFVVWGCFNLETSCQSCWEEVDDQCDNWRLMFWYGLALIITSNISSRPIEFYMGEGVSYMQTLRFYFKGKALPTTEEIDSVATGQSAEVLQGNVRFWTLMPSVFITWIFAKSIFNSANLGGMYGMWGGVAYASWYVSFFTAGIVCYLLRVRFGHKSMASAVYKNYGVVGILFYSICVCFRLFNEIWSNATVIGSFYGSSGSSGYWGACWVSTLIPAVYVVMGGMRASLFSDVFQAWFAVVFLIIVLGAIGTDKTFTDNTGAFSYKPAAGWYDDGWWACFVGGLLQGVLSYPFFDPVLTDRGFLGTPKTMLLSFTVGGTIAALFIFWYAVIGVYGTYYHEYFGSAAVCGCKGGLPKAASALCPTDWNPCARISSTNGDSAFAAWVLGHQTNPALEVFVNFIMITASMSTLDSTFTSWAKLVSLEFGGWLKLAGDNRSIMGPLRPQDVQNIGERHLTLARAAIVVLMLVGVAFLGTEKDAMAATSSAGTMVMGIGAPIWMMTAWRVKSETRKGWVQAPLAFAAPVIVGFIFGYLYYNDGKDGKGVTYDDLIVGEKDGKPFSYSRFLGTNIIGHAVCIGVFFVFFAFHQLFPKVWFWRLQEVELDKDADVVIGVGLKSSAQEQGKGGGKDTGGEEKEISL